MPPPRLPRHLRPCHLSGSTRRSLCASQAGYATRAADGGDAEQRSERKKPAETSWWTTVLKPFPALGEATGPHGGTQEASGVSKSSSSNASVRNDIESHGTDPVRAPRGAGMDDAEQTTAAGKRAHSRLSSLLDGNRRQESQSEGTCCAVSERKAVDGGGAPLPELAADATTLQALQEQVKALQATVAAMLGQQARQQDVNKTRASFDAKLPTRRQFYGRTLKLAKDRLRGSTHCLIMAANRIDEMSPGLRRSLQPLIAQHLQWVEKNVSKDDEKMMRVLERRREPVLQPGTRSSATTITQPLVMNAVASRVSSADAPAMRGQPRYTESRDTFKEQRDLKFTTEQAHEGYRHSVDVLVAIANQLQSMESINVESLADRMHTRLCAIAKSAKGTHDKKLMKFLHNYKRRDDMLAGRLGTPLRKVDQQSSRVAESRHDIKATTDVDTSKFEQPVLSLNSLSLAAKSTSRGDDLRELKPVPITQLHKERTANLSSTDGSEDRKRASFVSLENQDVASQKAEMMNDHQRLTRRMHTNSRMIKSSKITGMASKSDPMRGHAQSNRDGPEEPAASDSRIETSPAVRASPKGNAMAQSLLEELFPEANKKPEPVVQEMRDQYPKLDLPDSTPIVRRELVDRPQSFKEQIKQSFQERGEKTTVLQLTNCSANLTETDFLRLAPKSKHIEGWHREGGILKIIPGRDPLSLSRLPFYYILFKNPESALAYQKNVSRTHKLCALHQPSSIFSAIPPPKGFLEDGEDINSITSSYNLLPTHHPLSLVTLVQPYNPALRALLDQGGYGPIVSGIDKQGDRIWKVLIHIEGYEPTPSDFFKILKQDAFRQGTSLTLRNESNKSIHRLRDLVNLRTRTKPISSASPRAYGSFDHTASPITEQIEYDDPSIQAIMGGAEEDVGVKEVNQYMMNRLYNRWILDFEDQATATRFAINWHRRVLPEVPGNSGWRDAEETRVCNTEVLW